MFLIYLFFSCINLSICTLNILNETVFFPSKNTRDSQKLGQSESDPKKNQNQYKSETCKINSTRKEKISIDLTQRDSRVGWLLIKSGYLTR